MTMAITTIRLDYAALPARFDLSRKDGIKAEASDVISHMKIELPTAQLAHVTAALAEMGLI